MSTSYLVIRELHVISAAIWLGAAFFAGWFLMPAVRDTGPDGGKVMAAIQKRGWVAFVPFISITTVLSGFWLYRPYMGASGHAAMIYGYGGVVGLLAFAFAAGIVSRSVLKANALMARAGAMPEGPDRTATLNSAGQLRQRALTFARIVSLLLMLAAAMMTVANYI